MVSLQNEILNSLWKLLDNNLQYLTNKLTEFTSSQPITRVWKGAAAVIDKCPAIRIVPQGRDSEWGATRSQDDTYRFSVECFIRTTAQPEIAQEWIGAFEAVVMNLLLEPVNLTLDIGSGLKTYDGYATSGTAPERTGEGIYQANIDVWYKTWQSPIAVA